MPRLVPDQQTDDVYLVVSDFAKLGVVYLETDTSKADRATVIRNLMTGEYQKPVRVIAFNTTQGWSRDVSEDIAREILARVDHDESLSPSVKEFIGWQLGGVLTAGGQPSSPCPPCYRFQFSDRTLCAATASGFLHFTQAWHGPERYREPSRFDTMPSAPS